MATRIRSGKARLRAAGAHEHRHRGAVHGGRRRAAERDAAGPRAAVARHHQQVGARRLVEQHGPRVVAREDLRGRVDAGLARPASPPPRSPRRRAPCDRRLARGALAAARLAHADEDQRRAGAGEGDRLLDGHARRCGCRRARRRCGRRAAARRAPCRPGAGALATAPGHDAGHVEARQDADRSDRPAGRPPAGGMTPCSASARTAASRRSPGMTPTGARCSRTSSPSRSGSPADAEEVAVA